MLYTNPHGATCPWHDWAAKTGAPNIKWCEETLCAWISEPANTWSNLGYLIAGAAIFYLAKRKKHDFALKLFGPIVFFMGLMSLVYHMSNFYLTQVLDFVGMFFFVGWAIAMNLARMGKLRENQILIMIPGLAAVLTGILHLMYLVGIRFQVLVLIAAVVIIATEYAARPQSTPKATYRWFAATLALLSVAFSFSIVDGKRLWCDVSAHGWFSQGHAIWHWIASVAMFTFYLHYAQPGQSSFKNSPKTHW
ncbi:MAG: hypothetical protein OHK0011_04880 [Turneriella sp.]